MSEENQFVANSLIVQAGELTKPANTLVEKIYDAMGGIFAPYQTRRVAQAKADAALTAKRTELEITDLEHRAAIRWIEEEARHQRNMEGITAKALPQLTDGADPSTVEDDWIVNFFAKSRLVSDEVMQDIWARILAGEANAPGSYSKRTVNLLSDIIKEEAELFTSLCGFAWMIDNARPLVFDMQKDIYKNRNLSLIHLKHLESAGLIQVYSSGLVRINIGKTFVVRYYDRDLLLTFPKEEDNSLDVGEVDFTASGRELASICTAAPVEGFWEMVTEQWKEYHPQEIPKAVSPQHDE